MAKGLEFLNGKNNLVFLCTFPKPFHGRFILFKTKKKNKKKFEKNCVYFVFIPICCIQELEFRVF